MKIEEIKNTIINKDCIEVMRDMPENSVDLVLTDPPYGLGFDYGEIKDTQKNLKKIIKKAMPEMLRIGKRVILTCGHTNMWLYPKAKWVMAWVNPAGANMNSWGFTCWQPILCYGKDVYLENRMGARQDIIIHNEKADNWGHPCPKPLGFWEKLLIRGSVKENDTILDPFLGSGTTAVACQNLHRNYIGIEISEKYCEIARQRLRQKPLL